MTDDGETLTAATQGRAESSEVPTGMPRLPRLVEEAPRLQMVSDLLPQGTDRKQVAGGALSIRKVVTN